MKPCSNFAEKTRQISFESIFQLLKTSNVQLGIMDYFQSFLLKNRKKMTLVILVFKFILTSLGHFWSFRINGFVFQDSELRQPLCGRNSLNIQRQPSAARPSYDNVRHSRISSKHSAAVVNNMK